MESVWESCLRIDYSDLVIETTLGGKDKNKRAASKEEEKNTEGETDISQRS